MTYRESQIILAKIKAANKILVNCHQRPDVDSISSAFAMCQALEQLGKEVKIISPDNMLPELDFLGNSEKFEKVDYSSFDFTKFDLFLVIDSNTWEVVTGKKEIGQPDIEMVVIDHHTTSIEFGEVNLIDAERSAAAELLYLLFQDWGIDITKDLATALLTGIMGDTGAFEYHNTTPKTLHIAAELMDMGADKDEILLKIFRTKQLSLLKFWGKVLDELVVDECGKFSWCAISYEQYKKLGKPQTARESASSLFARMVEGTKFGIVMLEEEPGILRASFRARNADFDVSKIALALGGGGHSGAAGVILANGSFSDTVKKVVETARQFV